MSTSQRATAQNSRKPRIRIICTYLPEPSAPLTLQFQLAHEIAFPKRRALVAENVISRGRMEKEVRQRERHQEAFRRERKRALAELEGDIAANEYVDGLWRQD